MNSSYSDESNFDIKKEEYSSKYFKSIEYILGLLNSKKKTFPMKNIGIVLFFNNINMI
jgi:hypothetical protein